MIKDHNEECYHLYVKSLDNGDVAWKIVSKMIKFEMNLWLLKQKQKDAFKFPLNEWYDVKFNTQRYRP